MSPFGQFLLVLSIIVAGAKAGGWLASRLRQPAVVGELLVGLLLGPSVLGMLGWPILANLHDPYLLPEVVSHLAELGVICLMFLAGLEIDLPEMLRTGPVAVTTGISDVVVTFGLVSLATFLLGHPWPAAAFVGVALTATSVSISAQTLLELGRLRSREGLVLLSTAVLDDVLGLLLLSGFVALAAGTATPGTLLLVLVRMVGYLAAAAVLGFVLLPRLAAWVERQPISEGLAALVLVTVLLFALSAEVVGGLAAITGAFLAGLGFGRSHLRGEIARRIHTITYAFLVPIFFVSIGLRINLRLLGGGEILVAAVLALVAILAKVLGCGLGARLGGFNNRQALRVGVGMASRGEVGLIVATVGLQAGLIGTALFSTVTFIVLVTALVTPILLRLAFRNKEASHA